MTFLALIFAATAIAYFIAAHLRIPRIPVLILIGLAMSPFLADAMQIELRNHLDLSLTFLLFGAGTELNPARLKSHLKAAFWVGTMQFSVVFMGGLLMAGILGFGLTHAIVLASGLSVSSTLAVLQFLRTRQQIT
jgi:Kef-type K+ transport system membrane component KefB